MSPAGRISTVAGCGRAGLAGDGGPARSACLDHPADVAALPDGGMLIADTANHRIRRVTAAGRIATVAGSRRGFGGDGGPATAARLAAPVGVAPLPGGGFAIADYDNDRVRIVDRGGRIRSMAGRRAGFLAAPTDVAASPGGAVLVADDHGAVRRLHADGSLTWVVGRPRRGGLPGWIGHRPIAIARSRDGTILVADAGRDVVHLVATRRPRRLALRATGQTVRPGATVRQRVVLTRPATLSVTVLAHGEVVTARRTRAPAGASAIEVLRDAQAGEYVVDVVARAGGATTTATARLRVLEPRPAVTPEGAPRPRGAPGQSS